MPPRFFYGERPMYGGERRPEFRLAGAVYDDVDDLRGLAQYLPVYATLEWAALGTVRY